jgi:hypothetical protein
MTTIADAIDFVHEQFVDSCLTQGASTSEKKKSHSGTNQAGMRGALYACYCVMAWVVLYAHDLALVQWRQGWSGLTFAYFLGSAFEFMGLFCLAVKVRSNKSAAGVSTQGLVLFVTSLVFRVFTTSVYDGYLPVDKSGDFMAQMMDTCSIFTALYVLYCAQKKYAHTYQEEIDTMPVGPILTSCAVAAYFIHGNLNHNIFDQLWAFSLNIEVFQLMPQLYMLAKVGGVVDAATAHFVGNVFMACLCRFAFWMWAVPGCKGLSTPTGNSYAISDLQIGGIYILFAYLLQTLIALDFVYYYAKAWWRGSSTVDLPKVGEEF